MIFQRLLLPLCIASILALLSTRAAAQLVEHEVPLRPVPHTGASIAAERLRLIAPTTIRCFNGGEPYHDYLEVTGSTGSESFRSLRILKPERFLIEQISANRVRVSTDALPPVNSRPHIVIETTDADGYRDTVSYNILVSDPVLFSMPLILRDSPKPEWSAYRTLVFGMAPGAVTGEEPGRLGELDARYCEFELPPAAPESFDARWIVGNIATVRNFHPASSGGGWQPPWRARFTTAVRDTLPHGDRATLITWSMTDARKAPNPLYISDLFSSLFRVKMQTGEILMGTSVTIRQEGDSVTIAISLPTLQDFKIEEVPEPLSVDALAENRSLQLSTAPNRSAGSFIIACNLPVRGMTTVEIIDMRGDRIATLADAVIDQGEHRITWDGRDDAGNACGAGIYLCRLTSAGRSIARKLIVIR